MMSTSTTTTIALNIIRSSNHKIYTKQGLLCVLVHGLDSSSGTWKGIIDNLSIPCLAVDQRGCGKSDLGPVEEFSQDVLVDDLHQCIEKHTKKDKIILVGHSLGGRIAMGYAARYPENLAAVVIEDMDIQPRPTSSSPVPISANRWEEAPPFDRRFTSKDSMILSLENAGYDRKRIDGWWEDGRIHQQENDGSYWSNVNPDFRWLCYEHILSRENGKNDCRTIAAAATTSANMFPCHVLVAGKEGTVCFEESIEEMKAILQNNLQVHHFPQAGHSIHSTEKEGFIQTIENIIESCF